MAVRARAGRGKHRGVEVRPTGKPADLHENVSVARDSVAQAEALRRPNTRLR